MTDSSNPYAPPTADLGREPRARGNVGRYVIAVGFLLLAIRDSLRLLSISMLPEGIAIEVDALLVAFTVVLLVARVVAALAFFVRWPFAWFLGMALVGYSVGSMIAAMWTRGVLSIVTAILPLLIILIPHFAATVRSTFGIDRRKLMIGIGLAVVFAVVRAVSRSAPY